MHDLGLPGVSFEPEQKRVYPLGYTGAHIIGFADTGGDGLAGAEAALNEDIRAQVANHGTVPLSIDLRVQAAVEDELYKGVAEFKPKGAVALVINVHTGEILGMASYPTFDPNQPGKASLDARLNRAAGAVYEMGSTFKGFTVAMGLDSGVATPASTFDARSDFHLGYRTIHDYHATRKILTLVEVFQHSSNIGTARLAEAVGVERLSHYFKAFGLTTPAQVELIETARPLTPKVWNEGRGRLHLLRARHERQPAGAGARLFGHPERRQAAAPDHQETARGDQGRRPAHRLGKDLGDHAADHARQRQLHLRLGRQGRRARLNIGARPAPARSTTRRSAPTATPSRSRPSPRCSPRTAP